MLMHFLDVLFGSDGRLSMQSMHFWWQELFASWKTSQTMEYLNVSHLNCIWYNRSGTFSCMHSNNNARAHP